MVLERLSGG
jgi:nucleoside-diphosphate-sugar epimerase